MPKSESRPAKSRVDARRTDGRERVLAASVQCMNVRGYHGTSIRDIAVEAGMTSAALYHHFPSKQEILVEIMRGALADAGQALQNAYDSAVPTPSARLSAVVRAWVTFHAVRRGVALIGATEIRSLEPSNREAVIASRDALERMFRSIIDSGRADGSFSVPRTEQATRAILTMGTSVATWFDPAQPDTPSRLADEYADLALALVGAASTGGTDRSV